MRKYKFQTLAKPSGITLMQHRLDVMSEGKLISEQMPFSFEKYEHVVGKSLSTRLCYACKFHDDGKAEVWQTACQKDYQAYLTWKIKNTNKTYNDYVKENINIAGKNIRHAGIRHEFYSLSTNVCKNMPLILQVAIAAHHGKLGFKFENRWKDEGFIEYWKLFLKKSNDISENYDLEQITKIQYEFAGPRGLLQFADHRASAKEDGEKIPVISTFKYNFPFASKRGVQKLIEEHWAEDFLLVKAPTGAGKTDASLLWASLQIKNKRAGRMVIAMPTRFTSNALAISVTESLSDTGLYHSSAWFNKFQKQIDCNKIERNTALKIHELARVLETPVTVCTIDHLLTSLTLTREDHQLITFNLANSCLVIDEADFYDEFTQANILVLLKILKYWRVPILLMSASLPESVLYDYQKIGFNVNKILEDTSDNKRVRFIIKDIREYEEISQVEDLLYLMIEKGNGIIYANTIGKAISYFKWFSEYNETTENKINVIIYHSQFTEPDKEYKENIIINALGKNAWENGIASGIIIMTQIGEMSINISADIMISEICPIDRLTQRTGRMCRFDKTKIGNLYVLIPLKDCTLYPAPYGTFDLHSKSWTPLEPLIKTLTYLEKKSYNAEELNIMLNHVYDSIRNYSVKSITNAKLLKDYFTTNWLINPKQILDKDDTEANFWKSRDIAANDTVFVSKPKLTHYLNYMDFQCWKIYNSIDIPIYMIKKMIKAHIIDSIKVIVCEDIQNLFIIREGFYNKEMGIEFPDENNQL
jgi:CRISPR-associated endonuclease/helicase Cas3